LLERRVLHVYKDIYPPVAGGIERHIDAIRASTPGWRHDVLVCAHRPATSRKASPYGLETHVAQAGRVLSMPIAPTFPFHLRRQSRGAILHLHMPNPTGEASVLARRPGLPMVASYHCDIFRQRAFLPLYLPLLVSCLRRADVVIAGSSGLIRSSPVLAAARVSCRLVPYAVDVDRLDAAIVAPERVSELHARFGAEYILAVGRLVGYKGFERLIRLAPKIALPIVIVGDGPLREELRSLVATAGLADRVHLVGSVSDPELAAHFAAAAIFVMASVNRAESFGVATLEAQAASLPVVATDVGTGTTEAFVPDLTGVAVPSDNDAALVRALNDLAASPARREAMGRAGRKRVIANNSLEQLGARIDAIYSELASRFGPALAPRGSG
jgi:glycosyltransferase involved in cell wall biosynthesis